MINVPRDDKFQIITRHAGNQLVYPASYLGVEYSPSIVFIQITLNEGRIEQSNFPDYPLLRMAEAPEVEVFLLDSPYAPTGAGEIGIPPAAPALVNAIFAATCKRLRRLPVGGPLKS